MSDIAINPVTRRVQFTGNTGTGPFAFTFNILTDSDIAVFKNTTELTLTANYTVSINANGTGSITLAAALVASDVLTIIGGRELSRTTDFVTAGDLLASSLNEQLDSNVIMTQQLDEKLGRGLFVNPGDVFTDLELPLKDARKGTVLGFNATTGDPEPGPEIGDVDSLANISADIKTLAEIQDGTVATDAITNVNTIRANVTTVSGISGNVTTVAGNTTNINSVAGNSANINTVAGIDSDVTTVSGISGNVTAVAGNTSNINTVAADGADIGTVATSIASVNTVATDISNVNTNATNIASINTNATNITDIQNASTNAASALASKNAAATSATNSANSATASETSKVASVAAQAAAETAETNAETAETNAETAETNAAASASSASASASSASTSSSTATTQAGVATTKAGEAAASATASANSATASEAAKDAALAALDNFDDRYLGAKASDPTVDNDGNPLISGALYFNTTDDVMKVYEGSQWVAAYASLSGALLVNNNLSDVADAAGSRTNLGLGTGNTPTFAGINTTGNATFGDNDKAIFGAGSDLQIYHDGSDSFIDDAGTGRLHLRGNDQVTLGKYTGENMVVAVADGQVELYYDSSKKLATTSSGIDVTGNILRMDGTAPMMYFMETGVTDSNHRIRQNTGNLYFQKLSDDTNTATTRMAIDGGNGSISFYEDTGTTPKFFWDASAERLGIGTSSPDLKLDVSHGTTSQYVATFQNTADSLKLKIGTTTGGALNIQGANANNNNPYDIGIQADGGNVGIETTSPGSLNANARNLVVGSGSGTKGITVYSGSSNSGAMYFADGTSGASTYAGSITYNHADNSMSLGTNGSEAARLDASGNFLVGKTTIATGTAGIALRSNGEVRGTADGDHAARFSRLSSDGAIVGFEKDGSTVGSIGVDNTDNLTISGNSTHAGLNFSTSDIIPYKNGDYIDDDINLGFSGYRFKDLYLSGTANAANFNTTSDATLKTNVETLSGSLDAVTSLRGVSFDWLENGGSEIGVIAQEVEAVLPDVVSTNDEGIKSVKYGNMVAVLIEAIKEQQLRIEALEAKLGD